MKRRVICWSSKGTGCVFTGDGWTVLNAHLSMHLYIKNGVHHGSSLFSRSRKEGVALFKDFFCCIIEANVHGVRLNNIPRMANTGLAQSKWGFLSSLCLCNIYYWGGKQKWIRIFFFANRLCASGPAVGNCNPVCFTEGLPVYRGIPRTAWKLSPTTGCLCWCLFVVYSATDHACMCQPALASIPAPASLHSVHWLR